MTATHHHGGFHFRPTGINLLVGMIELKLGGMDHYLKGLKPLLNKWSQHLSEYDPGPSHREFDCTELYKTCAFVMLGSWDLVTLTLTAEKGLGTHFSFIGHIQGQSYFYAHDYSIVVNFENASPSKQEALARLTWLAKEAGCTVVHNQAGEADLPLIPGTSYGAAWAPLSLNHINGGTRPEAGIWPQPVPLTIPVDRKNQLLGLYQLKLNQLLWVQDFGRLHNLAFLAVLAMNSTDAARDGEMPDVVRPMFCDGYFDLVVLVRSPYLAAMDNVMKGLKYLTVQEALDLLKKAGIKGLIDPIEDQTILRESLFELTHSTVGFSNQLRHKCRHLWQESGKQRPNAWYLDQYRRIFQPFNYPKTAQNKEQYKVMPATRAMVNTGMMDFVMAKTGNLQELFGSTSPRLASGENAPILYGTYDFYVFSGMEPCFLGEGLAKHQLFKHLMLDLADFGPNAWETGGKNAERLPILSLDTQLGPIAGTCFSSRAKARQNGGRLARKETGLLARDQMTEMLVEVKHALLKLGGKHTEWRERIRFWEEEVSWAVKDGYSEAADIELQAQFRYFLSRFFGLRVTQETLDSFFTAFCAVEGALADPLRFALFLDVRRYLSEILRQLMTLTDDTTAHTAVRFFDIDKRKWVEHEINREVIKGSEAYFLRVIDLIGEVTAQRTTGSFPYHDRGYARLSDMRCFHTKKLVAVSWLINDVIAGLTDSVKKNTGAAHVFLAPRMARFPLVFNRLTLFEKPADHYLARFSNSPEALVYWHDRSIGLNSRHLTSMGSLLLLFHEIGHIPTHNIHSDPTWHELGEDRRYIWDEILADLHVFKLCFAPFETCLSALAASFFKDTECRVSDTLSVDETLDIVDLFFFSWWFQLTQLPRLHSKSRFALTVTRLLTTYCLLKIDRLLEVPEDCAAFLETGGPGALCEILIQKKLPMLKALLHCSDEAPPTWHGKDHRRNLNLHDENSLWLQDAPYDAAIPRVIKECELYLCYRGSQPLLAYASFLSSSNTPSACPYFKNMLADLRYPINASMIMEAMVERAHTYKAPADFFAATAQIVGLINLFYVGGGKGRVSFNHGYPGFSNHTDQMCLSRMRQLAAGFLMEGASRSMAAYYKDLPDAQPSVQEEDAATPTS